MAKAARAPSTLKSLNLKNMSKPPKLSILVPTYNYAAYLPQALQSVLTQDFSDFELIISDNASTDNTAEIIQMFLERDTRIRYIRQPQNYGMVANWNLCLQEARGEYVYFLFADDFLLDRGALSDFVATLDQHLEATLAVSPRIIVDTDGKLRWRADDLGKSGYYTGREAIQKCWASSLNLIGEPSAVMLRKSAMKRGFSSQFKQLVDLEMWIYCLTQGGLVFLEMSHAAFRLHPQQQTSLNRSDNSLLLEMFQLHQNYLAVLKPQTCYEALLYYQGVYAVLKVISRASNKSPEVVDAITALQTAIPLRWRLPAHIGYRVQRWKTTWHRSLKKRRTRT